MFLALKSNGKLQAVTTAIIHNAPKTLPIKIKWNKNGLEMHNKLSETKLENKGFKFQQLS